MFATITYGLLCLTPVLFNYKLCTAEPSSSPLIPGTGAYLSLVAVGELEYSDVVVYRVGDSLSLECAVLDDDAPVASRGYVWNYVAAGNESSGEAGLFSVEPPAGPTLKSTLSKSNLTVADSGHYMCSAPPFSVTKFILVQTKGPVQCARGAFWCGGYCVLGAYVCDGLADCAAREDEAPHMCARACDSPHKLRCASGRCVPAAACCRAGAPPALCRQPACCREHRRAPPAGYAEAEFPALFEDRRAPDDYGFIQSTIYTVTACALIFMIAVVLLVSALCKMHMKRAALRSYAHADRATRRHYSVQYAQTQRFPPCYEASRLLEQERGAPSPSHAAPASPARAPLQCSPECAPDASAGSDGPAEGASGLARLSAIFTARYRQVPTQCLDVEMSDVRPSSLQPSPSRSQTRPLDYRSPTYCDLNSDLFFDQTTSECGRELNYMATPIEYFRRTTLRSNLANLGNLDRPERPRHLTLQLGRFQLSIPRLGRRPSLDRRPDTPNVAEVNIDDMDFVRLNSNDTYTLNGRTIRLLGANFENYPALNDSVRPPPYTDAMRYKLYGPPPEYLSRDALNTNNGTNTVINTEEQARSNVEMPPCYEDLASGVDANANVDNNDGIPTVVDTENNGNNSLNVTNNSEIATVVSANGNTNSGMDTGIDNDVDNGRGTFRSIIDNLPAIDSDVNANETC